MPPKSQEAVPKTTGQDANAARESLDATTTTSQPDTLPPARTLTHAGQPRTGGVTRLESLSRRGGAAAPAPAKVLRIKPKAPVRRSLQERQQAEREEQKRIEARTAATNAAEGSSRGGHADGRGGFRSSAWRGRGSTGDRGGMRGGHMTGPSQRVGEGMASGPFGAGSMMSAKKKVLPSGIKAETVGRSSSGSSRAARKAGVSGDASGSSFKDEADAKGHVSSSDDDGDEDKALRVDIEYINLISDEEEHPEAGGDVKGKEPSSRSYRGLRPMRLDAREHVERAVGVGAETQHISSSSAGQQQGANVCSGADGVSNDLEGPGTTGRKAKERSKDVEFIRHNRKWRGVYQDEEEEAPVQVKQETVNEPDLMIIDSVQSAPDQQQQQEQQQPEGPSSDGSALKDEDSQKKRPLKGGIDKARRQGGMSSMKKRQPVLQTQEDREEWARHEEDVAWMCAELGPSAPVGVAAGDDDGDEPTKKKDDDGDVDMQSVPRDHKEGRLYLFQFPPMLPALVPLNPTSTNTTTTTASSTTTVPVPAAAGASEDDNNTNPTTSPSRRFPTGKLGKLRVHASGKVSLSWGWPSPGSASIPFELKRGIQPSFLQDVVMLPADNHVTTTAAAADDDDDDGSAGPSAEPQAQQGNTKDKDKDKEKEKERGKAISITSLSGKFIVVPDWDQILK